MNRRLFDFSAELRHETENAYLVSDGDKQVWLPKSLTQDHKDGTFTIPEWLAQEKRLI